MVRQEVADCRGARIKQVVQAIGWPLSSFFNKRKTVKKRPGPPPRLLDPMLAEAVRQTALAYPWWGYKRIAVVCRRSGLKVSNRFVYRVLQSTGVEDPPRYVSNAMDLARDNGLPIVVFMTDGLPTVEETNPEAIAERAVAPSLVSRLKILCGLDIADRLRPQDGRARVAVNGVAIDLRVSTLPASHGEKVAIRVLDARGAVLSLGAMGFLPDELTRIESLLDCREGLILVTGPTGSGKTTTLYAALCRLQEGGLNIVTVEDPIEYRLPGIIQVQVNERAGLTFASALRSIMRQDPDVLLIGEIRDRETAEIAIQASLTGHLVFSTLHTNDAGSAITRLVDIGVAPYKIATALKGVLAQRLVRRLCSCGTASPRCSTSAPTSSSRGASSLRGPTPSMRSGSTTRRRTAPTSGVPTRPVSSRSRRLTCSVAAAPARRAAG